MSRPSSPLDDFYLFLLLILSLLCWFVFIFLCLYRSQDYEINYLYFYWSYIFSHSRLGHQGRPSDIQCWLLWHLPKTSFQQNKSQVCSQSRKSRHAVCRVCLKLLIFVCVRSTPGEPPLPRYWPVTNDDYYTVLTLPAQPHVPSFIGLYCLASFLFSFCFLFEWALTAGTGVTRKTD